jgi:16S rRNA (cytosine967-C5)-methyltransferase
MDARRGRWRGEGAEKREERRGRGEGRE